MKSLIPFVVLLQACSSSSGPTAQGSASATTASATTTAAAEEGGLQVGAMAPAATFTLTDGTKVDLATLRGKQVLVYFYPKDDTPGCTVEAQGIRDAKGELEAAGVTTFGVSTQDATSHAAFIEKHELNFPLVVDTNGAIAKLFGVPLKGDYASRQSFLIDREGRIKKVWREVKPAEHAAAVIAAAKE